jgi:hypothetical protein
MRTCLLLLAFVCVFLTSQAMPQARLATKLTAKCGVGRLDATTSSGGSAAIVASSSSDAAAAGGQQRQTLRSIVVKRSLACWSVLQVVSILANAIKRLLPVAMEPLIQNDLQPFQWAMFVGWSLYMAYVEGYQAFQLKFSPLVVKRAFGLSSHLNPLNCILAGPYAMGLFGATKKRMIISWSITAGVFALVKIVKRLPYPYRAIVDAGVVVGLSYGTLSILWQSARGLLGYIPDVDPQYPDDPKKE